MESSKREVEAPAFAAGLGLGAASRKKANAFLDEQIGLSRKQSTIADLQIEDLKRKDKLRHWSLRVHHISDVLKLGFELADAAKQFAMASQLYPAPSEKASVAKLTRKST